MDILTKEVREATQQRFSDALKGHVRIFHFTQEPSRLVLPDYLQGQECMFCKETKSLIQEVCSLSEKIELILYDFLADTDKANEYNIDKIPATIITRNTEKNVRIFGIPSGYEYASFIEAILDVSKGSTNLKPGTVEALKGIDTPIHIQTFVTPTCPYCTTSVRLGHQFALESSQIVADMVEATEFPHLAQKYNIVGVPRTIINESIIVEGAVPEEIFLEHVLKAIKPEETK
ncbi:MAG: thioredoxin family protein [Candidatus Aminicenantes bacterium]|nr:MAG: thioredoxin family protein [Candidatus Aminicenantes bacterium]